MTVLSISSMANALANHKREKFDDKPGTPMSNKDAEALLGLGIGIFLVLFIIMLVLWIWALTILVKNWKTLPDWARVIGVLGVIPAVPVGPLITIIIVYIAKDSRKN